MSGDENPASKPTPVQDVQGDGRWMSLVSDPARDTPESGAENGEAGGGSWESCWFAPLSLRPWETEGSSGGAA